IVAEVEHFAVRQAAQTIDPATTFVPVDENGVIDLDALAGVLGARGTTALVSVQWANNETGVVQPIAEVARLAHRHGALLHVDAVQATGKVEVDLAAVGADFASLSAHKLGGPQGVGALIVRAGVALSAQQVGGGQELFRRAGTENVPGIAGFGVACELAQAELAIMPRLAAWRDGLEEQVGRLPGTRVFGGRVARLPNTSCFAVAGVPSETQVIALDLDGIAVSAGAACSSGKVAPSHVLRAMGAADDLIGGAIRVSLGWGSRQEDIEGFLAAWRILCLRAGERRAAA
ncbi:MAG: cysteine desulfurase, partial [Alphaproteobacteria bacterium]|nr:cysteine desulfurase [Alphaproteobacteria bacterium]